MDIEHPGPVIQTHRHVCHLDIGQRLAGQAFETAPEIITKQPQSTANKRQIAVIVALGAE